MSEETAEDVLSGIDPLPASTPPSPSLAPRPPAVLPLGSASLPSLTRSWPSSPLSASRQVTAHLYSSLQRSKEQEVKGYSAISAKARQVSFKLSSPELCSVVMPTATRSLSSDRLNESQEADFSLDAFSSHGIVGVQEAGSEAELMTEDMDVNLQSSVSNSAKLSQGRWHIDEMQNVRSHLQTMMNTAARITEETDELLEPVYQHSQDDSHESDNTSHLLSASVSLGGIEDLFPRYSRLRADVSPASLHSLSELQVTRESLERERARRKHAEQQVLALQNKALTLQQQLNLAVSADRKKDIMIEQLDKTLEKVVEGWRKHEKEKSEGVRRLQEEKETAERALACFEKSLSDAAETLDKEQKHNEELQNTNSQLERELAELRVCVEELQHQRQQLRSETEKQRTEVGTLQIHTQALQGQLEQATHTHTHLQQDISLLTQQLERERERVGQEVQLREEGQSRLQQLQQDLDETRRERDTARVDRALDQARFEAQCSQREVELRLSVEQQVTERLAHIQQENSTATAKIREQHRKQLLDLREHHERELSTQVEEFRAQLQEREERLHQLTLHCDHKIAEMQEQLVSMETSKRRLEMQREELVSRLQGMMRTHWTEALRLLTNPEQAVETPPSLSLYGTIRCPSLPEAEDTSSSGTVTTVTPAAPQAVVLHMCRDRQHGAVGQTDRRPDAHTGDSDFGLLNHSHSFSPLEPVLDDTNLTALGVGDLSSLWDKPLEVVKQPLEREKEGEITPTRVRVCAETLNPIPSHHRQDSYSHVNQIGSHVEQTRVNRHMNQNPIPAFNVNHMHSKNQSSSLEKGVGKYDISVEKHSTTGEQAPPIKDQSLSIKERTLPAMMSLPALHEDRQSELQYYISKLLDRSPGEPLKDQSTHESNPDLHMLSPGVAYECVPSVPGELTSLPTHHQARSDTVSTGSPLGCPRDPQLEQLTNLLRLALPSATTTHTTQQLQHLLSGLLRSGEPCSDTVHLDHKQMQHEKKECQAPPRPTQSTTSRRQRSGPQGQRPGSKVNVWR
ncbi:centrobin isoform X1 [Electrophorus electricus]|uniref:centrobin isoform X1 n=1 Tax=Electrophorus electricus TaxID=8005 RepID=UPI000F0A455D|nr:centrobin isoform X1 [Electrophorus electricus]XP_026888764.1 centrobin isoform X1 [Electrophorus electricus]XP_026888765.1 centrobin isoform X1 [Electrophorus electricus]XP_035377563.1 centrobin isoform X1 [Electrophorus electricus]